MLYFYIDWWIKLIIAGWSWDLNLWPPTPEKKILDQIVNYTFPGKSQLKRGIMIIIYMIWLQVFSFLMIFWVLDTKEYPTCHKFNVYTQWQQIHEWTVADADMDYNTYYESFFCI